MECPGAAAEAGVDGCMLDTIVKGEGNLFSSLSINDINEFLVECKNKHLISALAGSLAIEHVPELTKLDPDIIGFRGAVCSGDRVNGAMDSEEIKLIKGLME